MPTKADKETSMIIPSCTVDGCGKTQYTKKGLCKLHYYKNRPPTGVCSVDECEKVLRAKGYCNMHWQRQYQHGSLEPRIVIGENRNKDPIYWVYRTMVQRCTDKNSKSYKDYGGRGITVCRRWSGIHGFTNFRKDMGERPEGTQIDRIDNDGNYSPENCKWSTRQEQCGNRRDNKRYTAHGKTMLLTEWSEVLGVKYATLRARIKAYGWSNDEALSPDAPVNTKRKSLNKKEG